MEKLREIMRVRRPTCRGSLSTIVGVKKGKERGEEEILQVNQFT